MSGNDSIRSVSLLYVFRSRMLFFDPFNCRRPGDFVVSAAAPLSRHGPAVKPARVLRSTSPDIITVCQLTSQHAPADIIVRGRAAASRWGWSKILTTPRPAFNGRVLSSACIPSA